MREISEFVRDPAGTGEGGEGSGSGTGGGMGIGMEKVHEGMACVYERVERDLREGGEDRRVLEEFVREAKEVIGKKGD